MKLIIIITILIEIFFGVLGLWTGDMTPRIAMTATLVIPLIIVSVLSHFFKPREKRVELETGLSGVKEKTI